MPNTDPNSDIGKKPENQVHHLHIWKSNDYQDLDSYVFLVLDTFRELEPLEKKKFKEEISKRIYALQQLEHHFRLAGIIAKREKELAKDFPRDLLRIWSDFMTPMLVGKGGLKGEETAEQPHNLALVTVHGLMLQYRDLQNPDTVKKARNAFAINLSMHSTKRSFFTMEHILHALNQTEVKQIFDNPRFKRVEFTFDCGPGYTSEEMLYNMTKGFALRYPERYKSITWSPQCHCHGKSNLDRRFSSLTSWRTSWEQDEFHPTIKNINDIYDCLTHGLKVSNEARVVMDKKNPIPTDICIYEMEPDTSLFRPYVCLTGVKSTNAVTLQICDSNPSRWKLFNHLLPQIPIIMGKNITGYVRDGTSGKKTTAKMRDPGAKRKVRKAESDEMNPKTITSLHKHRMRFVEEANLQECIAGLNIIF